MKLVARSPQSPQPSSLKERVFCGSENSDLGGQASWEVWRSELGKQLEYAGPEVKIDSVDSGRKELGPGEISGVWQLKMLHCSPNARNRVRVNRVKSP